MRHRKRPYAMRYQLTRPVGSVELPPVSGVKHAWPRALAPPWTQVFRITPSSIATNFITNQIRYEPQRRLMDGRPTLLGGASSGLKMALGRF